LGPFFPQDWSQILSELSARPLVEQDDGDYGIFERADAEERIQRSLAFPNLNREFKHYV
jgi:hypothetical protein